MTTAQHVMAALSVLGNAEDAVFLQRFFKTGPGQYGEGDVFIGVRVPATRAAVKGFTELPLAEIVLLLNSEVHEHRLAGLVVLVAQFGRATKPQVRKQKARDEALRGELADFYLAAVRRGRVNNWDLVDGSAEFILGEYLMDRPRDLVFELVRSAVLWERRVGMLATFAFIKRGDASTTLEAAELLLDDAEDLMHKAVGWMLREVGKRVDRSLLIGFLDAHAAAMPRTALSYATEHLSAEERAHYRNL